MHLTHPDTPLILQQNSTGTSGSSLVQRSWRAASSVYSFYTAQSGYSGAVDTEFRLRGDGNGLCDGAWTGGGADYAEYFESVSGNSIPVGTTVVLEGSKVRPSMASDSASAIVGVVRPKGMAKGSVTIGNSAWNHWNKKYLTDEYGAYIMEPHEVIEWTEIRREYESGKIPEGVVVPSEGVTTEIRERTIEFLVWTDEANGTHFEFPVGEEIPEGIVVPEDARTESRTVSIEYVSWIEATTGDEGEKRSYESWNMPLDVTVQENATRKTHDDQGNRFEHRKPNPEYDPEAAYVPRENRPEWVVVGLIGQIPVTRGQTVGDRWTVMHEVSPSVDMWFVR